MIKYITGINSVLFNGYVKIRMKEKGTIQRTREQMNYFQENKLSMMWYIGPLATPANLLDLLKVEGFDIPEGAPAMACYLRGIEEDLLKEISQRSKLQVKIVKNDEDYKA